MHVKIAKPTLAVVVAEDGERVSGLSDLDELLIIDGELALVP